MAIDADLNAGIIDQDEAKARRALVSQESDFYCFMDGASKFVRGDAVAGILILLINLIGGVTIGLLQYDLSFDQATKAYVLLTIGDGLVAQIPRSFVFVHGLDRYRVTTTSLRLSRLPANWPTLPRFTSRALFCCYWASFRYAQLGVLTWVLARLA